MNNQQIFLPILVLNDVKLALSLSDALLKLDIDTIEITLRTDNALDIIRAIRTELPEMTIYAGTVLTRNQADQALEAGATALISPGYDSDLVAYVLDKTSNTNAIRPGVNTPSLVQSAIKQGLTKLKFFPAELSGGIKMLKLLHDVYPTVRFTPTGGVNTENISSYLALPNIDMLGGTWLCKPERITAENISDIARDIADVEQSLKGKR